MQETEGRSYEALKTLIDHAVLRARLRGEMITQQHLEDTLDEEIRHILPHENKDIPATEKILLATHFASHALALQLLDAPIALSKVTINPVMTTIREEPIGMHLVKTEEEMQQRHEYGYVFTHHRYDTVNAISRASKLTLCKLHLAGNAGEKLLLGSCSYSCHKKDKEQALAIANSLVFEGIEPNKLLKHQQKERQDKALALLDTCEKEIYELLTQNKELLTIIRDILIQRNSLTADEITAIIQHYQSTSEREKSPAQAA